MYVDLDVLRANAIVAAAGTPLCAVVKADAYGLGAVRVARALRGIARSFAVAVPAEAEELVRAGIAEEITVLGRSLSSVKGRNVTYSVSSRDDVDRLSRYFSPSFAIAVDSGMHRFGADPSDVGDLYAYACERGRVRSVYTHLRAPDDEELTDAQLSVFRAATEGMPVPAHVAASGALYRDDLRMDIVRPGVALYGGAEGFGRVMRVTAPVLCVRRVPAGEGVGYGSRTLMADTNVAVIGIGYADGYRRLTAPRYVSVDGMRCRVISVCMDVCFAALPCDVTSAFEAEIVGDEITLSELAKSYGSIPYEVLTSFGRRVQRIYTGGEAYG